MKFYKISETYLNDLKKIDKNVYIFNNTVGIIMRFFEFIYYVPVDGMSDSGNMEHTKKSTPAILRFYGEDGQLLCQCRLSSMIPVPYHDIITVDMKTDSQCDFYMHQLNCLSKNEQRIFKAMKRLYNQKIKGYDASYLKHTVDFKKAEEFTLEFENRYYGKHINRFPDDSYFLINPSTQGFSEYFLMNKNIQVARLVLNNETNEVKDIVEIIHQDYAPLECFDHHLLTKERITTWFKGRSIPSWRDGLDEFLENIGVKNKDVLLNKAFGLSLSDQYWMNPCHSLMIWEDINFFHHDFNSSDYIQATFFNKVMDYKKMDLYTPNNTSDGMLKKTWIVEDGKRYLLKGTYKKMYYEPFNEVLASWICDVLNLNHVEYSIDYLESLLVSKCECFIDENTELISAYALVKYYGIDLEKHPKDVFNDYIRLLESQDVQNAREDIVKMFILDYLIINEDRHLGNFGVIRDVNTLKLLKVAPNYDNGLSMYSQKEVYEMNFEKATGRFFNKEAMDFETILAIILEDYQISIQFELFDDVLQKWEELLTDYKNRIVIDDERIQDLVKGLKTRIKKLRNFFNK